MYLVWGGVPGLGGGVPGPGGGVPGPGGVPGLGGTSHTPPVDRILDTRL